MDRIMADSAALFTLELPQTFDAYHASANEAVKLLKASGIPNVEKLTFPADGKTVWQDKIAPMGWNASIGKATVLAAPGIPAGTVIADYAKHPFYLIRGSVSTRPGGEIMRLLSYEQVLAGCDPHDALVLTPPDQDCRCRALPYLLDLGARGVISDFSFNQQDAPGGILWNTAFTEHDNWHVNADDRDFIAFSIPPATGTMLRKAVSCGEVKLLVESDARREESTFDLVTALIPGKRKEEFWIYAHLYEPLANDNSSGVASAIETARLIMQQGNMEFSLRLIFSLEHYGYAAYAVYRGNKHLAAEVIGACDYDAMMIRNDWSIELRCAASGTPFYGNYILHQMAAELNAAGSDFPVATADCFSCMYDDDCFLSDSTTGVPTIWPIRKGEGIYHNSMQTLDYIQPEALRFAVALNTALISAILSPTEKMLRQAAETAVNVMKNEPARAVGSLKEHLECRYRILHQDIINFSRVFPVEVIDDCWKKVENFCNTMIAGADDEIPHSPWRDYAANITVSRLTTGFPFDLAKVPFKERILLPASVLYGPLSYILSDLDGKTDLAAIIRRTEHEQGKLISENEIGKIIRSIFYLARHGYVSLNGFTGISRDEVVSALQEAGVQQGDFLLVHSAVAGFGKFENDMETVVDGFKTAIGPNGTALFAAFTSPFIFLEEPNMLPWYRPGDPDDAETIVTGILPKYVASHPCIQSCHLTHRWCGFGKDAAAACAKHKLQDPPVGENSPLVYALAKKGKVVHFGSGLDATTFLHVLEDRFDLPGVGDTLCRIRQNGVDRTIAMPRNLPGHRDFYQGDETTIKFFRAAIKKGLTIRKAKLGNGEIMVMDLEELDKIGSALIQEDPFIMLCDDPGCLSCQRLRKKYPNKQ